VINGITFDSKKEAKRYTELKILESAKLISHLELQPEYLLIERTMINGKNHRAIIYKADFKYYDNEKNKLIVEDVKGYKTDVYALKKRLMKAKYGIEIFES